MSKMGLPSNIILVGFMGSGKTATGKELSKVLHFRFWDMDQWIEDKNKKKIPEIFCQKGERYFRQEEIKAIKWLRNHRNLIISIGGGTWIPKVNRRKLLKLGWCVWLKVSAKTSLRRISRNLRQRPLLSGAGKVSDNLKTLLSKRDPLYSLAHVSVQTNKKKPKEVAMQIMRIFRKRRPFDLPEV